MRIINGFADSQEKVHFHLLYENVVNTPKDRSIAITVKICNNIHATTICQPIHTDKFALMQWVRPRNIVLLQCIYYTVRQIVHVSIYSARH